MTTAQTLIEQASRTARVLSVSEPLASEDAADRLGTLNQMLHAWALTDVISGHTDLSLPDTILLPDSMLKAARYLLAEEIAVENGAQLTPSALGIAAEQKRLIEAKAVAPQEGEPDETLLRMAATTRPW